jgi:hypothetical protein
VGVLQVCSLDLLGIQEASLRARSGHTGDLSSTIVHGAWEERQTLLLLETEDQAVRLVDHGA